MNTTVSIREIHPSNDKWVVPKNLVEQLGEFDVDVNAPYNRPWSIGRVNYTALDNGINKPWDGRVFCHPPEGKVTDQWLNKCAQHGNCIALVYAKSDSILFHEVILKKATAILFIKGRVKFCYCDGSKADSAPLPSILVAFDEENARILEQSISIGSFIRLKK